MTTPIDLSKYAKGRRLKCTESFGDSVVAGCEYVSCGHDGERFVCVTRESGATGWFATSRFVPVEDEAPGCLCGPMRDNGRNRSCPEHGVRCNRADCDKLCDGVDAMCHYNGQRRDYCSRACHDLVHPTFAHPVATPVAASLKADPYKAHRDDLLNRLVADGATYVDPDPEKAVAAVMATEDTTVDLWKPREPTNRERLVAALKAEMGRKPIEPRFPPESKQCRVYRSNDR